MNLMIIDNVLHNPKEYVSDILSNGFQDVFDQEKVFKGIQPRNLDDEFAQKVLSLFPDYKITWNFVRQSPYGQEEPNYIHTDEMMGDITVILYLNEKPPNTDGTTLYDEEDKQACVVYSKYNRMIAFDSHTAHSRNIFKNFGVGNDARLIQVIFLKEK